MLGHQGTQRVDDGLCCTSSGQGPNNERVTGNNVLDNGVLFAIGVDNRAVSVSGLRVRVNYFDGDPGVS